MIGLRIRHWTRAVAYGAVLLVLLAVFWAYLQPDFLVTLANQVWTCF